MTPLLDIRGLTVRFRSGVEAVRGVDCAVLPGETLALVGASGSGKSTVLTAAAGLLPADARVEAARLDFEGRDLLVMPPAERRGLLGRRIGVIFQDPVGSLSPHLTVGFQIVEALRAHADVARAEARTRAAALLEELGVDHAGERLASYPHELSGGQCQRVAAAMALAAEPALLLADEPTTALDVVVQAHLLRTLRGVVVRRGVALVLVSHDLSVVGGLADRVAVMDDGRVVECGAVADVMLNPKDARTRALLAASLRAFEGGAA